MASNVNLWVEIAIETPGDCPVAAASAERGATASAVSWSSVPDRDGLVTEEFVLDESDAPHLDGDSERIASHDSRSVYRFPRPTNAGCVCETVEALGEPVADVRAVDGTLRLSFHASDLETVREVVATLRERFEGVSLTELNSSAAATSTNLLFVDRDRLTDRQWEVLRTAYEMGYFEHPRSANACAVAEALGISPSTFSEHLAASLRKALPFLLSE